MQPHWSNVTKARARRSVIGIVRHWHCKGLFALQNKKEMKYKKACSFFTVSRLVLCEIQSDWILHGAVSTLIKLNFRQYQFEMLQSKNFILKRIKSQDKEIQKNHCWMQSTHRYNALMTCCDTVVLMVLLAQLVSFYF
jgi:hypothetical protein